MLAKLQQFTDLELTAYEILSWYLQSCVEAFCRIVCINAEHFLLWIYWNLHILISIEGVEKRDITLKNIKKQDITNTPTIFYIDCQSFMV